MWLQTMAPVFAHAMLILTKWKKMVFGSVKSVMDYAAKV